MLLLWMDELLHQFETMGNHLLLVTGESTHSRVSERWCEMDVATIHRRGRTSTACQLAGADGTPLLVSVEPPPGWGEGMRVAHVHKAVAVKISGREGT